MEYDRALETGLIQEIYPLNEYLDNIIDNIDMQAIRSSRLEDRLDPMDGVSETSIKTILLTARCEVDTIHERHDTPFGGKLPRAYGGNPASSAEFRSGRQMRHRNRYGRGRGPAGSHR